MTDDTAVTDRFRQLKTTDDELPGDTVELEELDVMATDELRQLLEPAADGTSSLGDDVPDRQDDSEDADRE